MNVLSHSLDRTVIEKSLAVSFIVAFIIIALLAIFTPDDWWQTPDQQAQKLYDRDEYTAAAKLFSSPQRRGAAYFRAGEFKAAVTEFARVNSANGHFNRGNALVMSGKYADAITAYERTLTLNSDFHEATNNLEIARLRAEKSKLEGGDMTGTLLGADEVVFNNEKNKEGGGEEEQIDGEQTMSDLELQSLWLRRVQTKPADFLRIKFAFQLAIQKPDQITP